ncbi:MAG: rRNA maturation RNase YbeY [Synergistaceae bacterium]|nr:rRNA maturation RNase YbeY [Synergistaceae bacterium]
MKLLLHVDAPEEGDPQSCQDVQNFFAPSSLEGFAHVFEEELLSLSPDIDRYDSVELSVSFLSGAEMREVNRNFRGVDEATDVLSFPLWEEGESFVPAGELRELLPLGDILVCPEETVRLHDELSRPEALCLMLAHGFLHLLAWDHDTPERERAMWERQDRIREKLAGFLELAGKA